MPTRFHQTYLASAECLLSAIPSACGTDEEALSAGERRLGVRLPASLRAYYAAVGRLEPVRSAHNRLLSPRKWFVDDGRLVFIVENQAVVYWGVEATDRPLPDPEVFQGVNLSPDSTEWHHEHDLCSEFLLVMMHWQMACGGFDALGTADLGERSANKLMKAWRLVGEVNEIRAYQRPGQAACVVGGGGTTQVYVGARTKAIFETMAAEFAAARVSLNCL